jgi:hypothetical protein
MYEASNLGGLASYSSTLEISWNRSRHWSPRQVCLNMVRQGVVCTRRLTSEDWDSPASNTSAIQKLIRVRYKHS